MHGVSADMYASATFFHHLLAYKVLCKFRAGGNGLCFPQTPVTKVHGSDVTCGTGIEDFINQGRDLNPWECYCTLDNIQPW